MSMMKTFGLITKVSEVLRKTFLETLGLASPNSKSPQNARKQLAVV